MAEEKGAKQTLCLHGPGVSSGNTNPGLDAIGILCLCFPWTLFKSPCRPDLAPKRPRNPVELQGENWSSVVLPLGFGLFEHHLSLLVSIGSGVSPLLAMLQLRHLRGWQGVLPPGKKRHEK